MKRFNGNKIRLAVVGIVAVIMLGSGSVKADFTFGEATTTPWPPTNTIGDDRIRIFSDELTIYTAADRTDGHGAVDLYVCTRSTTDDPWSEPVNLGPAVNSPSNDFNTVITSDGLELYFCSDRPGGYGSNDIWMTRRQTKDSPWSQAIVLDPPTNGSTNAWQLISMSSDDLEMFFVSANIPGGYGGQDIWSVKRATRESPWGAPVNAGPNVNSGEWDNSPVLLPDDLTLIFSSARLGGFSTETYWDLDLWLARRETKDSPWGQAVNLGSTINTKYTEMGGLMSADGQMLYFRYHSSGVRPGGNVTDIWQAPLLPIVDLNSDGIVDSEDMFIIVDHWGEDYSLCDIGPMPWGDGIVDVRDMVVLTKYMSPEPFSYWKLDESEGMFAIDSAGGNNAVIAGNAVWRPGSGQLDGALQFNGMDCCAITGPSLNPASGPFSIFAWIKVAIPGKVVVSQQTISEWLKVSADGKLMTEIKDFNGLADPLISETVITDGQWHRIGLVWDGSHRILYVDGDAVAEDTLVGLESSQMGLYIGVDKNYTPDTFFAGMIDDIRIYNVALSAEQIEGLAQ